MDRPFDFENIFLSFTADTLSPNRKHSDYEQSLQSAILTRNTIAKVLKTKYEYETESISVKSRTCRLNYKNEEVDCSTLVNSLREISALRIRNLIIYVHMDESSTASGYLLPWDAAEKPMYRWFPISELKEPFIQSLIDNVLIILVTANPGNMRAFSISQRSTSDTSGKCRISLTTYAADDNKQKFLAFFADAMRNPKSKTFTIQDILHRFSEQMEGKTSIHPPQLNRLIGTEKNSASDFTFNFRRSRMKRILLPSAVLVFTAGAVLLYLFLFADTANIQKLKPAYNQLDETAVHPQDTVAQELGNNETSEKTEEIAEEIKNISPDESSESVNEQNDQLSDSEQVITAETQSAQAAASSDKITHDLDASVSSDVPKNSSESLTSDSLIDETPSPVNKPAEVTKASDEPQLDTTEIPEPAEDTESVEEDTKTSEAHAETADPGKQTFSADNASTDADEQPEPASEVSLTDTDKQLKDTAEHPQTTAAQKPESTEADEKSAEITEGTEIISSEESAALLKDQNNQKNDLEQDTTDKTLSAQTAVPSVTKESDPDTDSSLPSNATAFYPDSFLFTSIKPETKVPDSIKKDSAAPADDPAEVTKASDEPQLDTTEIPEPAEDTESVEEDTKTSEAPAETADPGKQPFSADNASTDADEQPEPASEVSLTDTDKLIQDTAEQPQTTAAQQPESNEADILQPESTDTAEGSADSSEDVKNEVAASTHLSEKPVVQEKTDLETQPAAEPDIPYIETALVPISSGFMQFPGKFGTEETWVDSFFITAAEITNKTAAELINYGIDKNYVYIQHNKLLFSEKSSLFYLCDLEKTHGISISENGKLKIDTNKLLYPVTGLTWYGAAALCDLMSIAQNYKPYYNMFSFNPKRNDNADGYRLPTPVQWFYAAAGGETTVSTETSLLTSYSGSDDPETAGVFYPEALAAARTKQPNGIGLFDMSGNVREYCDDHEFAYLSGRELVTNPTIPVRGGSYLTLASYHTIDLHDFERPNESFKDIGIRIIKPILQP